jgi:tetratricopeptide (TPR) repeat protein
MLLLLATTLWSLKKTRLIFFSLGFYFITIALVLQFVSVGTALVADRYSYLPYVGLAFLPATLIADSSLKIKKWLLIVSGFIIIILMLLTRQQVKVWTNTETLWTRVIERYPKLELPRKGRGKYYYLLSSRTKSSIERARFEEKALADFDIAIRERTRDADVYDAAGVILNNRGDFKRALVCINEAVSLEPGNGGVYYNRAMVYDALGRKDEAIKDYTTALGISPELSVKILSNRAVLLTETGRFPAAERDLTTLIAADQANYMYYYNRAYVRVREGNYDGAASDYRSVLRLKPDNSDAKKQLQLLLDQGIK